MKELGIVTNHPVTGLALMAAGTVPWWFNSNTYQIIYYILLIPPAAYYCYTVIKTHIIPSIKLWFK